MGLDMFLFAKSNNTPRLVGDKDSEVHEVALPVTNGDTHAVATSDQDSDDLQEVAYWRKANQIHRWFVTHVQDGVDECRLTPVSRKQLEDLRQTCMKALDTQDSTMLEPCDGFFFGSTAIDEYYWDDLRTTIDMLDNVVNMPADLEFFYQSSW